MAENNIESKLIGFLRSYTALGYWSMVLKIWYK